MRPRVRVQKCALGDRPKRLQSRSCGGTDCQPKCYRRAHLEAWKLFIELATKLPIIVSRVRTSGFDHGSSTEETVTTLVLGQNRCSLAAHLFPALSAVLLDCCCKRRDPIFSPVGRKVPVACNSCGSYEWMVDCSRGPLACGARSLSGPWRLRGARWPRARPRRSRRSFRFRERSSCSQAWHGPGVVSG